MTSATFQSVVSAFASYPEQFKRLLTDLADRLSSELRDEIVQDLRQGEQEQMLILDKAIVEVTQVEREFKAVKRQSDERSDKSRESLPSFV